MDFWTTGPFDTSNRHSGHADAAATRAASAAERSELLLRHYETELAKLRLVSRAMWELVKQKTDLADEDLHQMFQALYETEGVDRAKATECTGCGRVVGKRQKKCLYCGLPRDPKPL